MARKLGTRVGHIEVAFKNDATLRCSLIPKLYKAISKEMGYYVPRPFPGE